MPSDTDQAPWRPGAAILVACALVAGLAFADRCEPEGKAKLYIRAYDGQLAVDGSPVRVYGVEVGRVTAVCLFPDERPRRFGLTRGPCTRALLESTRRDCPVPSRLQGRADATQPPPVLLIAEVDPQVAAALHDDAHAQLVNVLPNVTRTGLRLDFGAGAPLRENHTICATDWSLVDTADALLKQLSEVVETAHRLLALVKDLVARLDASIDQRGVVGALLDERSADNVASVMEDAAATLRATRQTIEGVSADLRSAIKDVDAIAKTAADRAPKLLDEASAALESLNRSLLDLEGTLRSLRETGARGPEVMDRAITLVEEVQRTIEALQSLPIIRGQIAPSTTEPVPTGRPALTPPVDTRRAPASPGGAR
ncbi:MAG: hypothetical protein H6713_40410 [Myxococcales bacterium]|nr:hypothetical protein [Myxococcales bacterium]